MPQETDTLIIGAGIAGLATASMLSETGRVTVITKGKLKQSNTYWAQGGISAVLAKEDSFEKHIEDTLSAGHHHGDERAVRFLAEQGPKAFRFLRDIGVDFQDEPMLEAAHSYPRVWRTSDFTGQDILNQLIKKVKKQGNITLLEDLDAVEIIVQDGEVNGAFVRHAEETALHPLLAKNTILATGGCGQLFDRSTNTLGSGGDGLALAINAGLELKDMEFMQFHPTALNMPDNGRYFLLSEALRGEGATLLNQKGERFITELDKRAELAPRDIVARAVYFEMMNGPVYLDMRHIGSRQIKKTFPNIYKRVKEYGLDMGSDLLPVTPAAHYMCGGIPTDLKGATHLPGLFAVGEVACTGIHGANRLASNSLLEAVVFSRAIAETLEKSASLDAVKKLKYEGKLPEVAIENLTQVKTYAKRLGQIMWEHLGPMRTPEGLVDAKKEIACLPAKDYRIQHRQLVCYKIVEACQKRTESLGTHAITQAIL